eukprot:1685715-Prymnesium_polylepis.2
METCRCCRAIDDERMQALLFDHRSRHLECRWIMERIPHQIIPTLLEASGVARIEHIRVRPDLAAHEIFDGEFFGQEVHDNIRDVEAIAH